MLSLAVMQCAVNRENGKFNFVHNFFYYIWYNIKHREKSHKKKQIKGYKTKQIFILV